MRCWAVWAAAALPTPSFCEDAVYASRTAKQCGFYLIDIEDACSAADKPELRRLADQYIPDWTKLDWAEL